MPKKNEVEELWTFGLGKFFSHGSLQTLNSQYVSVKLSRIGHCVSRINCGKVVKHDGMSLQIMTSQRITRIGLDLRQSYLLFKVKRFIKYSMTSSVGCWERSE